MKRNSILYAVLLLLMTLMLIYGREARQAVSEALGLCAAVLIPSLFPFSVLFHCMLKLGFAGWAAEKWEKPMQAVFHLPGQAAIPVLTGLLGGFPIGANTLAGMYKEKALSRSDAIRISAVCNQVGPSFLLGAVGCGVLRDSALGIGLFGIHMLSVLLTALLLCSGKRTDSPAVRLRFEKISFSRALTSSVGESAASMLRLTGTVVFFSVLVSLLRSVFHSVALPEKIGLILWGTVELSAGAAGFSCKEAAFALPALAFLVSWGGLCVHLQAADALLSADLPVKRYFFGKLIQAFFALSGALLVTPIFLKRSDPLGMAAGGIGLVLPFTSLFLQKIKNRIGKSRGICYNVT